LEARGGRKFPLGPLARQTRPKATVIPTGSRYDVINLGRSFTPHPSGLLPQLIAAIGHATVKGILDRHADAKAKDRAALGRVLAFTNISVMIRLRRTGLIPFRRHACC
jgi:hypothetical protein